MSVLEGTVAIATGAVCVGVISAIATAFVGSIISFVHRRRRTMQHETIGRSLHADIGPRERVGDRGETSAYDTVSKSPETGTSMPSDVDIPAAPTIGDQTGQPVSRCTPAPTLVDVLIAERHVLDPACDLARYCADVCANSGRTVVLTDTNAPILMHADRGRC